MKNSTYAAFADKLGDDVVDAVLVLMGDTPQTRLRLALYAAGVGDSDKMGNLLGRPIVLFGDELAHLMANLTDEQRSLEALATSARDRDDLERYRELLARSEAVTATIWDQLP